MPTPATGSGADVSKGLSKFSYALYFAPVSGGAVIPAAKLLTNEPSGGWVRQGRLKRDQVTWNVPEPSFMEGRAGFSQVLKFRVVNQAEIPQVTATLDETDPEVQQRLRGGAASGATSLSSGAYTGYKFIYQAGKFLNAKALLVGSGIDDTSERQVFAGNAFITFRPSTTVDDVETLDVSIAMCNDSSDNAFTIQDWN